eukprot:CAMPEP_0171064344 /NCGR_PEP_ID=MMETSP0766_2-20121228/6226_1 /TAXON_ID=439317 /ORGANISM="Gambierdiscus australes, Strain CAWD 149" /LENGTH=163 /DNA_ID=CAMNT_0011520369 /DNA_START=16 /DNA_END=507 /DNA_ORIENTATION=-
MSPPAAVTRAEGMIITQTLCPAMAPAGTTAGLLALGNLCVEGLGHRHHGREGLTGLSTFGHRCRKAQAPETARAPQGTLQGALSQAKVRHWNLRGVLATVRTSEVHDVAGGGPLGYSDGDFVPANAGDSWPPEGECPSLNQSKMVKRRGAPSLTSVTLAPVVT